MRPAQPLKRAAQFRQVFRRDARPFIQNAQSHAARRGAGQIGGVREHGDLSTLRAELDRVGEQVDQDLLRRPRVCKEARGPEGDVDGDIQLRAVDFRAQRLQRFGKLVFRLKRLELELAASQVAAGDVQHIVHQMQKMLSRCCGCRSHIRA